MATDLLYGLLPEHILLGLILGPMMEENLRRAMLLSRGDFTVFLTRPISATIILVVARLSMMNACRTSVLIPSCRAHSPPVPWITHC